MGQEISVTLLFDVLNSIATMNISLTNNYFSSTDNKIIVKHVLGYKIRTKKISDVFRKYMLRAFLLPVFINKF